jgi:glycosyltransferase involved in cell wall biosynthesis
MSITQNITPLVSVALCTYNGGSYLREQLDTILQQTYSHIELVAVDDVSTDDTLSILKEYAAKDHRIQLYVNESNLGFNLNFQKAISLCKGDWIAIADQDDIWKKTKIEKMLQLWNGSSVLLHCASRKFSSVDEINSSAKPATLGFEGTSVAQLAAKNTVEGHTILFHHALVVKALPFPEGLFYDWWLGAAGAVSGGVQCIHEILVWRRIHEQNTYEKKMAPLLDEKKMWLQHLAAFRNLPGIEATEKDFIETCLRLLNTNASYDQWYSFILKNRNIFFYYKKGIFAFVSRRKHSGKLAKKLSTAA